MAVVYICFMIILIFLIITGFLTYCLYKENPNKNENFSENFNERISDSPSVSKFYIEPINKLEKIDSLYSPFVTRPRDTVALKYNGNCKNELFPSQTSKFGKGEMASPCCPDIEGRYYGMRPILNPEVYQDAVQLIFNKIERSEKFPKDFDKKVSKLIYQNEFCNGDSYSSVMKFIFDKINQTKNSIEFFKKYAKADTWGGEQFAYLNEKVFMFTEQNPAVFSEQEQAKRARRKGRYDTRYIVSFTLYNTLRSNSLDTTAVVVHIDGKYYITNIRFTTNTKVKDDVKGFELNSEIDQGDGVSVTPNWIYGNTIENTTFNVRGFHDPVESNNILIPGGIPEEYIDVIEKCDQAYLMKPEGGAGSRFKGGYQSNNTEFVAPVYPNFPDKNESWSVRA